MQERTWSYGVNVIHLDEDRIHLSKYYFSYIEDVSENKMSTLLCVNRASLGILLIVYDKSSGKWNMITTPELEEFQMPLSEMGDVDDMFPVSLDIDLTNTRTIPGRSPSDRKNRIAPVIIIYSNLSNIISLYYDVRKPALDMLMSERSPLPTKAQTAAGDKKPESYLDSSAVIKKEVTFSESAAIILKDPLENSSAEVSLL